MLTGRNIIRSAEVCSLGDGKSIRAFLDPWIPGRYDLRRGDQSMTKAQANTRVEEWIDHDSRRWKENVVREAVSSEEPRIVINVPIPAEPMEESSSGHSS